MSQISAENFKTAVSSAYTDVVAKKVGGRVLAFSDEWFADASNLIEPREPIRDANRFTTKGAWYDGWETRRHNRAPFDWVVLEFGVSSARLIGAEVDTAFFNGNHAPHISVEAVTLDRDAAAEIKDWGKVEWEPVLPKLECGPSQKFFFTREAITAKSYTHARLCMYPDGGIARFRLYGQVIPVFPESEAVLVDTASVQNGGVAVKVSDQHFGSADNLLLPGRGHDMSDGWETKRSREKGHIDWAIIKLGAATKIEKIVADTAHFKGNFPQSIIFKAIVSTEHAPSVDDSHWEVVVPQFDAKPHYEHVCKPAGGDAVLTATGKKYTHVMLVIVPDGGVKRVRVFGTI